jgi:pyridoxamine 5'-phosphate oxidase
MSLRANLRAILTLGRGVVKGIPPIIAGADPMHMFGQWFREAREAGIFLPEAMTLATSTPDGHPSARMMLLKGFDERGFAFYTNYESRKGSELDSNPRAAIILHWAVLERQIRDEGTVTRMTDHDSAAYFRSRPRGSQIGAWASEQSRAYESRGVLDTRFQEYEKKFANQDVPLPPFWGGFRLVPERIEFWQGRINRLHDRLEYTREGDVWKVRRLYP